MVSQSGRYLTIFPGEHLKKKAIKCRNVKMILTTCFKDHLN